MSNETLTNQRELFDLPPGLTYLNCAFMSPQPWPVTEAGQRAVAWKARPWEIGPACQGDHQGTSRGGRKRPPHHPRQTQLQEQA